METNVIPSAIETVEFISSPKLHDHEETAVIIELAEEIKNNNSPRIDISTLNYDVRISPELIAVETLRQASMGLIKPIDDILVRREFNGNIENIPVSKLQSSFQVRYGYDGLNERPSSHIGAKEPYTTKYEDRNDVNHDVYRSLNY